MWRPLLIRVVLNAVAMLLITAVGSVLRPLNFKLVSTMQFVLMSALAQLQWHHYVYKHYMTHLPRVFRWAHLIFSFLSTFVLPLSKTLTPQSVVLVFAFSCFLSNVWLLLSVLVLVSTRRWHKLPRKTEASIALFSTLCFAGAALYEGSLPPQTSYVNIAVRGLQQNVTITHVSDMHLGPILGEHFCENVLQQVRSLGVSDFVFLTGDIFDAPSHLIPFDPVDGCFKHFPSRHGIAFTTGNHEHINHVADEVVADLKRIGVKTLENDCVFVSELGINLAGTTDLHAARFDPSRGPDVDATFAKCRKGFPVLFLAHQPNMEPAISTYIKTQNVQDDTVIFSGHTHAGQGEREREREGRWNRYLNLFIFNSFPCFDVGLVV